MPINKVAFQPGINSQVTPTLNEGGFSTGNHIRWQDGLPQKLAGWVKVTTTPFVGIARGLHSWATLDRIPLAAVGTNKKLQILEGGLYPDITPTRETGNLTDPFSTTNGSAVVSVADTSHGLAVGDYVRFSGANAVGGITVSGEYTVTAVTNANAYTITHSAAASSTASGGGTVAYTYLLTIGSENTLIGLGWGSGTWGQSTWGTPRAIPTGAKVRELRTWSLDNWGEDLIANPRGGKIYVWDTSAGTGTRAVELPGGQAPTKVQMILVATPERRLLAFGADSGGTQDPLLVRWSEVEDYTIWTASATNTAGSFRVVGGTQIMTAVRSRGETVILTDSSLIAMRFIDVPYIYGFENIASGCGAISAKCAADFNGTVFWMTRSRFYAYNGTVTPLPCTVENEVFGNLNYTQAEKVCIGVNKGTGEILWSYPSAGSNENDSYVKFNVEEGLWDTGTLDTTAWADAEVFDFPLDAAAVNTTLYFREVGLDDDADAILATVTSGYFDLADGQQFVFIDQIIPDFQNLVGSVNLYVEVVNEPAGTPVVKGPFRVEPDTKIIPLRVRGRQARIRIESDQVGDNWRLGAIRIRTQADGRR